MVDNLDAWPSDGRRFDVVEFYHKILWASQECEQVVPTTKKGNRVTFSVEPPVIYEYESEYSNTNKRTSYFDYQNFKSRQGVNYYYSQPPMDDYDDYDDDGFFQNHRLMKTRSLSEFKPIINQDFHSTVAPCYQPPTIMDDDPPPSYVEYNVYSNLDNNFFESRFTIPTKKIVKKESTSWVGQAFFQKTLRKIKSSPRLIIQRRASMVSLRKNKSFFSLAA